MKNAFKLIGIIAVAAMIGFSFVSCPNDNGGGGRYTRLIFDKKAPPANLSAAQSSRSMIGGTTWDEESFSAFNDYYDSLNGLVRSYTPTEFSLGITTISAYGNYYIPLPGEDDEKAWTWFEIFNFGNYQIEHPDVPWLVVDFANMSVIPIEPIPTDSTATAMLFMPLWSGDERYKLSITFTLDEAVHSEHPLRTTTESGWSYDSRLFFDADYYGIIARDGNKVSVQPLSLCPYLYGMYFHTQMGFYAGTEYKCFISQKYYDRDGEVNNSVVAYQEFLDSLALGLNAQGGGQGNIFTPMAPVHIPSDATDVDITLNWYLTDIIEQYKGADNIADTEDDVFVLARDFWQRLSLSVSTQ